MITNNPADSFLERLCRFLENEKNIPADIRCAITKRAVETYNELTYQTNSIIRRPKNEKKPLSPPLSPPLPRAVVSAYSYLQINDREEN